MTTEAAELRRCIVQTAYHAGEGHIPSALSIVDIVWTLYDQVMVEADRFVLSKGHGCLALYVVLEAKGIITAEDLDQFAKRGGRLGGHPGPDVPGVCAATGSLGHGLPIAVGMAYAKKLANEPGRVFCLVGDGEMQEGSCIEALRLAQALDVSNLCVIVDANASHPGGTQTQLHRIFAAYGFTVRAIDGHDRGLVGAASDNFTTYPLAVIAQTVKGNGVKMMEKNPGAWHRRVPTPDEYRAIMEGIA